MIGVGLLVGFSFKTGVEEIAAGIMLCLLIGYAFCVEFFAFIGLTASSAEAANAFQLHDPLSTSAVHVICIRASRVDAVVAPGCYRRNNPFTKMVNAIRALFVNTPASTASGLRCSGRSRSSPCSRRWLPGATAARSGAEAFALELDDPAHAEVCGFGNAAAARAPVRSASGGAVVE